MEEVISRIDFSYTREKVFCYVIRSDFIKMFFEKSSHKLILIGLYHSYSGKVHGVIGIGTPLENLKELYGKKLGYEPMEDEYFVKRKGISFRIKYPELVVEEIYIEKSNV